jgi:hypothetical protein
VGTLIAIDPGECCGWAIFEGGILTHAGADPFGRAVWGAFFPAASLVVVERPQIYGVDKSRADPNDLITLAVKVGRICALAEECGAKCETVLPREWKGNLPKDVCHERALGKLSPDERRALPELPRSVRHNMLDAVGIGLWKIGR